MIVGDPEGWHARPLHWRITSHTQVNSFHTHTICNIDACYSYSRCVIFFRWQIQLPLQTSSRRVGWNERQNLQREDQHTCRGCRRNQQHQVISINYAFRNCDLSINVVNLCIYSRQPDYAQVDLCQHWVILLLSMMQQTLVGYCKKCQL